CVAPLHGGRGTCTHRNRQSSPTRWLSKRGPCGPEPERAHVQATCRCVRQRMNGEARATMPEVVAAVKTEGMLYVRHKRNNPTHSQIIVWFCAALPERS